MSKFEIIYSDGSCKIEEYPDMRAAQTVCGAWNLGIARTPAGAKKGTVWAVTVKAKEDLR